MDKWEYTTFNWDGNPLSDMLKLNQLGKEGWGLIQIVNGIGIMKRKLTNEKIDKEKYIPNDDDFVDMIYDLYPTKCPKRGTSLGKSRKDKERIKKLLKNYTKEQIESVVKKEVSDKYNKEYMQNFSTFLNNFPDPNALEQVPLFYHERPSESNGDSLVINGHIYR